MTRSIGSWSSWSSPDDFTAKDVRDCSKDIPELEAPLGKHYTKLLRCGIESRSCGEFVGCAGGAIALAGERVAGEIEDGFENMLPASRSHDDDGTGDDLPPECRRFTAVCDPSETMARRKCAEMAGNLKAARENRKKLAACTAASKNCCEFENCATQMWFVLH
ncbi:MAG: hypothetical protein WKG01_35880 [Kofleriaceae bacterium]